MCPGHAELVAKGAMYVPVAASVDVDVDMVVKPGTTCISDFV